MSSQSDGVANRESVDAHAAAPPTEHGDHNAVHQALLGAGLSVWEWTSADDSLHWIGVPPRFLQDVDHPVRDRASFLALVQEPHRAELDAAWQAALASGRDWSMDLQLDLKDCPWVRSVATASKLADGQVRLSGWIQCIERQKEVELELRRRERQLNALINHAPICIHQIDLNGRITSMNRTGLEMMGLENPGQICGVHYLDCTSDQDRTRIGQLLQKAIKGEGSEFEFTMGEGSSQLTFSSCFVPMRNELGEVYQLMGITADVTEQRRAERELKRSTEGYELAQRVARLERFDWTLADDGLVVSNGLKRMLGLGEEANVATIDAITSRIDPDYLPNWREAVRGCVHSGRELRVEFPLIAADGEQRWILALGDLRRDANGVATRLLGALTDITRQRRDADALRESQERYELAVRGTTEGVWDWNITTGNVFYSPRFRELLGYDSDDLASEKRVEWFTQALHPNERDEVWAAVDEHLQTREPFNREFRLRTQSGRYRLFHARGHAAWADDGTPTRMAGSIQDVTEQHEAQRLLREVVDLVPHQIFAKDAEGRFILSNSRHAEDLGLTPDEVTGRSQLDLTPDPQQAAAFLADDQRVIQAGRVTLIPEEQYTCPDGRQITLQTHKIPLRLPQSPPPSVGVLGVAIDITHLKETEHELRLSQDKFRSLVETTSDWVWEIDTSGHYTYSNPQLGRILGYSDEEVRILPREELFEDGEADRFEALLADSIKRRTGWRNTVLRMRARSGEVRFLESSATTVVDEHGVLVGFRGIDRDITDRKRAEEELAKTRSLLGAAVESSPAGVMIVDASGNLQTMNRAGALIGGLTDEEFEGENVASIVQSFETLDVHGQPLEAADLPLVRALSGETTHNYDMIARLRDGELRWLLVNAAPVRNTQGAIIAGVAMFMDVTDLKQGERQRESLIEELEEKNAELERFTYTVSHDLKSPIITIKGFLGLLEKDLAQGRDQVHDRISRIRNASDQMSQLLDELLELARIGRVESNRQPASLTELAQEAVLLIGGAIEKYNVQVEVQPNMPTVLVDRNRIIEALQNLLDNACRFSKDKPHPTVKIGFRVEAGEDIFFVADNGIGIPHEYHDKVLGLFEQLHPEEGGTGIGLAIVKRIIETHEGRLWIESPGEGLGATVCFTLGESESQP